MRLAVIEAQKAQGKTYPNPIVGALIVESGQVVARGYHEQAGQPHAEVVALNDLGRKPLPGSTIYVTMEPCSTKGRTGPCTDAIIKSGVSSVVIGAIDPNPQHQGRGLAILKEAGLDVRCGVLEKECVALNIEFNERMRGG